MTLTRTVKRAAAVGLGAVAVATALPAGTGHADVVCTVTRGDAVRHWPSYNADAKYSLFAGAPFQWTGLTSSGWSQGNYQGFSVGWFPTSSLSC